MEAKQTIEDLLTHLEQMVNEAWSMPLSGGKIVLDRDRVTELLTEIRTVLPGDLQQAKVIVQSRNELAAAAQRDAEAIIRAAEVKARDLVSESAIMNSANRSADALMNETNEKANSLMNETTAKANDLMNETTAKANDLMNNTTAKAKQLLSDAENRAAQIMSSAESQASQKINAAETQANATLSEATAKAKELYQTSHKFVSDTMTRADDAVTAALNEMQKLKTQFRQVTPRQ